MAGSMQIRLDFAAATSVNAAADMSVHIAFDTTRSVTL